MCKKSEEVDHVKNSWVWYVALFSGFFLNNQTGGGELMRCLHDLPEPQMNSSLIFGYGNMMERWQYDEGMMTIWWYFTNRQLGARLRLEESSWAGFNQLFAVCCLSCIWLYLMMRILMLRMMILSQKKRAAWAGFNFPKKESYLSRVSCFLSLCLSRVNQLSAVDQQLTHTSSWYQSAGRKKWNFDTWKYKYKCNWFANIVFGPIFGRYFLSGKGGTPPPLSETS